MRSEVPNVSNGIDVFAEPRRELIRREELIDLFAQTWVLDARLVPDERLKTTPTECSTGLRAVRERDRGLFKVRTVRILDVYRERAGGGTRTTGRTVLMSRSFLSG